MKKLRTKNLWLLATLAVLTCLILAGSAAAATPVSVELDGVVLTFEDAAPEIVNGRTFLPYRGVFTALGAEVSYEEDTRTAVAVRGDITVRVPIGSTQVTVTENGTDTLLEMDVASYVKGGRTYVPVRFMAQALGCVVGWDDAARTVILIDAQKLAAEAVAGQSYGYLNSYRDFLAGFRTGNWSVTGTLTQRVAADGAVLMTTDATYSGLTAGESRMQLTLAMTADRTAWYEAQAAALGLTLEQAGVTESDLRTTLELELRGNTALGRTYLCVSRLEGAVEGLTQGTWYSMGRQAQLGGVDLTALLQVEGEVDAAWVVAQALTALAPTDRAKAMDEARALADLTAANLTNVAFTGTGETRTARWAAGDVSNTLTLALDGAGTVTAYELEQTMTAGVASTVSRTMMDSLGTLTAEVTVTAFGLTVTVTQIGQYTPADTAPETVPPTGATVVPYGS